MRCRPHSWISWIADWKLQAFALFLTFIGTLSKVVPEYLRFLTP